MQTNTDYQGYTSTSSLTSHSVNAGQVYSEDELVKRIETVLKYIDGSSLISKVEHGLQLTTMDIDIINKIKKQYPEGGILQLLQKRKDLFNVSSDNKSVELNNQ